MFLVYFFDSSVNIGKIDKIIFAIHPLFTEQIILYYAPNRLNPVNPTDFFPFGVGPAGIGNADFINSALISFGKFRESRHELRLDPKALRFQFGQDLAQNFFCKNFVAGFYVSQVKIRKNI